MTIRQQVFVREYLLDQNATRAAIAAGYSNKSAHAAGSRLLKHVEVRAELARCLTKTTNKLDISAEKVLGEIANLAFSNMQDYTGVTEDGQLDIDLSKLTREQFAAIQEITVDTTGGSGDGERRRVLRTRFKLADKKGSLELLGNYMKLFSERVEHTGADGGPIQTAILVKFVNPTPAITD